MVRVIKRAPADMILEEQSMPEKQIKVRVSDRWRVVHDDKAYVKGERSPFPRVSPRNGNAAGTSNGSARADTETLGCLASNHPQRF
jgi:hypothetical protein